MLKNFTAIFCLGLIIPLHPMQKLPKVNKKFYSIFIHRDKYILHELVDLIPSQVEDRYEKDHIDSCCDTFHIKKEFIRYAYLAKALESSEEKPLGMFSQRVDNFWHTFLLFNKNYEQFCKKLPQKDILRKTIDFIREGKSFSSILYHNPYSDGQKCPDACQYNAKEYFKKSYREMYGDSPSQDIWSGLNDCQNCPMLCKIKEELESKDMTTDVIIGASLYDSSSYSSKSSSSCGTCWGSSSSSISSCSSSSSSSCSSDSGSSCSSCGGD